MTRRNNRQSGLHFYRRSHLAHASGDVDAVFVFCRHASGAIFAQRRHRETRIPTARAATTGKG